MPAGAPDGPQEKQGAQQQQQQQQAQAQAPQRVVIVAPHENNVLRAKHFQKTLINHLVMAALEEGVGLADGKPLAEPQIELATVVKMRDKRGELERHLIGDVDGALCIIVDDLLDTGVTVTEAADLLKSMNAGKVYAFATHGRFSGDCANTIVASKSLEWVVCTDTIPFQRFVSAAAMNSGKIQQLSLAPLIAEVIHRLHAQRSMRDLLGGQKEAD
uniref:ribose-phosphate diphosphokinase n=1 Tax=Fibrocapsa japonica TaxID=94617 RepID=A0A7S2USS9_9STRA|mmetsp:Transcript_11536/g.17050  ORF Transcript_11536/g.17050 Transcript_11536/m.17050 type:complete len:216 (+) Transcript_11536:1-648(+)